jgi:hypothetical protein
MTGLRLGGGDDDLNVGDPAVADERLLAVE